MDDYLWLVLLSIAAIITSFVLFDVWHRRQQVKRISILDQEPQFSLSEPDESSLLRNDEIHIESAQPIVQPQPTVNKMKNQFDQDLVIISIFAKPGNHFASYDLLQAISATGMQFGDMNIFHYYEPKAEQKNILFSLASATRPGEFDLNNMGDFTCPGLILFMHLSKVTHPEPTFKTMLETAEQLADDLDGELRADPHTQWTEDTFHQYQHKIAQASLAKQV